MKYGKTVLVTRQPWGTFVRKGTRLLCSDGKVRSVSYIAQTADTFFSIPCSVKVGDKTVSGYATNDEDSKGHLVYSFRHHTKHAGILPDWPVRFTTEHDRLVAKAY